MSETPFSSNKWTSNTRTDNMVALDIRAWVALLSSVLANTVDDDVGLNVLECRADTLGTTNIVYTRRGYASVALRPGYNVVYTRSGYSSVVIRPGYIVVNTTRGYGSVVIRPGYNVVYTRRGCGSVVIRLGHNVVYTRRSCGSVVIRLG